MTLTCDSCGYPLLAESCLDGCKHRTHCDCEDVQTAVEHESPETVEDYDLSCGRVVKQHAVDRWIRRNDLQPPCDIGEAWEEALPVSGGNLGGTARLHPPTGLVLVAHGNALRTALRREWVEDLTMDHLKDCGACGRPWYPGKTDACPWCDGEESDRETTENMIPATGRAVGPTPDLDDGGQLHDCPVCGDETVGDGDDDRCKVCRELDRTVDEDDDGPDTCAECYRDAETGSAYCNFHSYLATMEGAHAE